MSPIRVDIEERQRQIIEAATGIFTQRGYADARIIDIARAAGLGKGTLYQYFPSKQALFVAVFDAFMAGLVEMTRACFSEPTLRAQVEAIVGLSFGDGTIEQLRAFLPLSFEFWSASARGDIPEIYAHFQASYDVFVDLISEIYRAAIVRGEIHDEIPAEDFAAALIGLLDGLSLQLWFRKDADVHKAALSGARMLLSGIEIKEEAR